MRLDFKVHAKDLYKYSIFFKNYISNVAEDVLKNGITLNSVIPTSLSIEDALDALKIELKATLLQCIISYRFNGVGYILVKTEDQLQDLHLEVNKEFPTGFMYLDYNSVRDEGPDATYITYNLKVNENDNISYKEIKIHKSRVIIHSNYDYILKAYSPCYTQSFLLNIYLFEQIYKEIEKRIKNHNFLFYKDEALVELQDALVNAKTSLDLLTRSVDKGSLFTNIFRSNDEHHVSKFKGVNNELERELYRLKGNLNNEGIFYSGTSDASLEVIKYDITYLKEALALVKAKIGADTKEPLTRSFNEQVKGLGSDGKGDRSNYYDFLKGVQEELEISCNSKLNKYYYLDIRFNSLHILTEEEKYERDSRLIELTLKYKELEASNTLSKSELESLRSKLFFYEI
ncbi:DUF1073 domain-containing protein (plasmid) [Borrelia coriaceae]|uniref:Anti-CBASS protein Acb1-like N-terminal domain-containing protein n=1 Tax=Borrelia coriaceae ATCC 43381 TaxID=1408429 RepID=W5SW22_9SPIR|nr:anti-CBASS Acb1 family protein [Borrelia coriaceae]AHH11379.1 Hypothetical protein BCO_0010400 [Borrelia coriaceae ATCC 43381]UPA16921.1 DUF1073 domain-containing protein [Borrelia coriaceae]